MEEKEGVVVEEERGGVEEEKEGVVEEEEGEWWRWKRSRCGVGGRNGKKNNGGDGVGGWRGDVVEEVKEEIALVEEEEKGG